MHVIVLGAGIIGVSTAWHLLNHGHEVTLVDRQDGAGLETSYANAGQISVSYCEPWANKGAPMKALKWMFSSTSPLLLRPRLDPDQWRWCLAFLRECNDKAFARNVAQLSALGTYSHRALKTIVAQTGIAYHRLEKGIAHFYCDQAAFDAAAADARSMEAYGIERRVVSGDELVNIEPALASFGSRITGATYTDTDETGDAHEFTHNLAWHCQQRGANLVFGHEIEGLEVTDDAARSVHLRERATRRASQLHGDAVVVACGSYTPGLLKPLGIHVPIYPGKGYSVTLPLLRQSKAPFVSMIDDERKIAFTRLGDTLRVAGTIELGGFDLSLHTSLARARCEMLLKRTEEVFPGVADTRTPEEGGTPSYWCGLRPATPTNVPIIGRVLGIDGLWINAGHGTLGWTHGAGSGKALAELISGIMPEMPGFRFFGH
ncbi:D-amino acid dehydrogenase [Hydrogenophaga sp. 5NK40-0174]|uniref:D-amino acid dehydrogenase n=1 Tax=Hydrogenophaga sp. 5NK40-0174 TaxID=3127649 RepID=UPI00310683E9